MIEEISKEAVIGTSRLALSLPPGGVIDDIFVSALLRRAATIHCPCSPATIASSVRDSLRFLVADDEALRDAIDDSLEGLMVAGDLLELSQVSVDDPDAKGTWVFLAPPAFVVRPSGSIFLVGISPDEITPLPPHLRARVEPAGYTRAIHPKPGERVPLPAALRELGLLELSENLWLRAPKEESAPSLRDSMYARLAGRGPSGSIDALEILDPESNTSFYKRRWTKPKRQAGNFVARRPQAYGAPIWCLARLIDGEPRQILDFPLPDKQAVQWRGCDAAWHLQLAIDSCNGRPQRYRRRQATGGAILDFFSPLPIWARRRLAILGRAEPRERSLFSYFIPARELDAELDFLHRRLWLAPEQ